MPPQGLDTCPATIYHVVHCAVIGTQEHDVETCAKATAAHCSEMLRCLGGNAVLKILGDVEHVGAAARETTSDAAAGALSVIVERLAGMGHGSCLTQQVVDDSQVLIEHAHGKPHVVEKA